MLFKIIKIYFAFIISVGSHIPIKGQNYSGLQGKDLELVNDLHAISSQVFPEVMGTVLRTFVRFDGEEELKIVLQYAGYVNTFIKAEILDSQFKIQKGIPQVTGKLTGKSPAVELVFKLKPNQPVGRIIRSSYLRITISSKPGLSGPNIPQRLYKLNKAWQPTGANNALIAKKYRNDYGSGQAKSNSSNSSTVKVNSSNNSGNTLVRLSLEPLGDAARIKPPVVNNQRGSMNARLVTNRHLDQQPKEIDRQPKGPSQYKFSLWENIQSAVDFNLNDISAIGLDLYYDLNENSRQFYFMPNAYYLLWVADQGFSLKNLYGTAATEGQAGTVKMHAILTPQIDNNEINFIRKLIDLRFPKGNPDLETKLIPLPVADGPQISFSNELGNIYDIPKEKISINVTSDIANTMAVSWSTDSRTRDEMAVALKEGVGINGSVRFQPLGDSLSAVSVPLSINIKNNKTYPIMTLDLNNWRKNHWINPIPYPIKLKYIHVMVTEESEGVSPKIYSWDLKGDPVPVNGKVFFDSKKMPDWIDFNPQTIRAWIDYQVLPCKPCDDAIINASLGGTSRSSSRYITFELFDVIQQTQAKFLQIDMRSKQANPGNQESIDLLNSLKISQDGGYTAGPLYIDSFQKPSFEYRISLIMPDGTQFKGEKWISSQDLEIYLGYKNIMEQIPEFTANQDQ